MEVSIKVIGVTFLLLGVALPIWSSIQILFHRGFQFRKSRLIPAITIYGLAIFLVFFFWDESKHVYNIIQLFLYGTAYYIIGTFYSWVISLKSKHWRALIQLSSLAILGVPLLLMKFQEWDPIDIISIWGGLTGFYFLGYCINATWSKEHTLSGVIILGSFLFVMPELLVAAISTSGALENVKHILELLLLVILIFSGVIQWVRARWILQKPWLIFTGLSYGIFAVVLGYFIIDLLPEFQWKGTSVNPNFLLLFLGLGAFSGLLTYLIGLKAKLLKNFILFAFLQDRSFVINIERYSYLFIWAVFSWAAYFFTGVPGIIFLLIGGLGSIAVNYSVHFTNTVLYGWAIAFFLVYVNLIGDVVGLTSVDLAHPKIILWAAIGGIAAGAHLFLYDVQRLIFEKRNFDLVLIFSIAGVFITSLLSIKIFLLYELLGGMGSAFAFLLVILFASWLRNDRTNFVNPLWLSFSWIAFMTPVVQQDDPTDFSENATRSAIVEKSSEKTQEQPEPFDLGKVQGQWKINNEESILAFTLISEKGNTSGKFSEFSGQIDVKDKNVQVNLKVKTASVDTDNSRRDESLRTGDGFFESEKYPTMSYSSEKSSKTDTAYLSKGDYSLLGQTKTIEIPFKILGISKSKDKEVMIIEGHTTIHPEEYGMTSVKQLGDRVEIKFSVHCLKR